MPVFQDDLFSSARVVERTLASGTVLRLKLEPLPGERVRVLEYHRKAPGERWERVPEEESRTLRYDQLKLSRPFAELFPAKRERRWLRALRLRIGSAAREAELLPYATVRRHDC